MFRIQMLILTCKNAHAYQLNYAHATKQSLLFNIKYTNSNKKIKYFNFTLKTLKHKPSLTNPLLPPTTSHHQLSRRSHTSSPLCSAASVPSSKIFSTTNLRPCFVSSPLQFFFTFSAIRFNLFVQYIRFQFIFPFYSTEIELMLAIISWVK